MSTQGIPQLIANPLSATIATLVLLPPLYWRRRQPFPTFLVTVTTDVIQGWLGVAVGAGVILLVMVFAAARRPGPALLNHPADRSVRTGRWAFRMLPVQAARTRWPSRGAATAWCRPARSG